MPQGTQLRFQRLQRSDALGHMADVRIQQSIHFGTVGLGHVPKLQQGANFF